MPEKFKWETIILFWLCFFFNQADRQIFNVALPLIKEDLELTDVQLGLISSIFIVCIGVFVPLAGYIGDLFNKKTVVVFSLLIWSAATFLTGFSTGFLALVILRAVVGGSEAFYAPAANALIGEKYKNTLGFAMSIHQTALYLGIILSGVVGGYIAETYGWKSIFYLFGGIGIFLFVLMCYRLEPGKTHEREPGSRVVFFDGLRILCKNRSALLMTFAFSCMVFVNVGYLTWTPLFLHEKFAQSITEAGFSSMFYHHFFAFFGVMLAGRLSDRFARRNSVYRLYFQALGLLLGAPFIFLIGMSENIYLIYFGLSMFGLFRGVYDSNIYASLYSVIDERVHSSVAAAMIMFAYIFGALAPIALATLKGAVGLSMGISSLSVLYLCGCVLLWIAAQFTYQKNVLYSKQAYLAQ